jgi:hypothetical protein
MNVTNYIGPIGRVRSLASLVAYFFKIEFLDRQIFLSGKITLSLEPIDHYISKQYYLFMVREHFGAIYSDHIPIDQNMTLEEIVDIFHSGMLKYLKKLISISPVFAYGSNRWTVTSLTAFVGYMSKSDNQQYLKTVQQFYEIGAHKYIESERKIDKFNLN